MSSAYLSFVRKTRSTHEMLTLSDAFGTFMHSNKAGGRRCGRSRPTLQTAQTLPVVCASNSCCSERGSGLAAKSIQCVWRSGSGRSAAQASQAHETRHRSGSKAAQPSDCSSDANAPTNARESFCCRGSKSGHSCGSCRSRGRKSPVDSTRRTVVSRDDFCPFFCL